MCFRLAALTLALSAGAAIGQPPTDQAASREAMAGRPPRGSLFISPMGEPFRSDDPAHDNVGTWFAGADRDRDGALTLVEMQADAARFYAALDSNHDGEIDPNELTRYERDITPEVQVGMQMGAGMGFRRERAWGRGSSAGGDPQRARPNGGFDPGLEGAGRYSFLNIPEPVISADADLNRGVSLKEFVAAAGQRFVLLDANHDDRLTRNELPPLPQRHQGKFKPDKKAPKTRTLGTPVPM